MPPEQQYLLGAMNAKLDTLIQRSNEDRKTVEKLTARVEKLETWKWMVIGAASGLGGVAGVVTSKVFTF